ncbi:hypothetical protein A9G48_10215 [Gilliamella sp. wkB18]|uniref:hypothetical protein n=1 Tax=Gilliamella sp. wkB18 TaxID=3120260 RepID=UPI00080ED8F9|nr:hypothetical protein [Gilliamella apicola]OCG61573.1 hypothetical protein A9G48_10215 [Gilliamella apicola]
MPSQYQPQIFGWIGDLVKGGNSLTDADDRLLYANDNYCAFIRKTKSDQLLYLCMCDKGVLMAPNLLILFNKVRWAIKVNNFN